MVNHCILFLLTFSVWQLEIWVLNKVKLGVGGISHTSQHFGMQGEKQLELRTSISEDVASK